MRCPKCGGYELDDKGLCKNCGHNPDSGIAKPRLPLEPVDPFKLAEGLKSKKEQKRREAIPKLSNCPYCSERSLFYNIISDSFECLNSKLPCPKYKNPILSNTIEYNSIITRFIEGQKQQEQSEQSPIDTKQNDGTLKTIATLKEWSSRVKNAYKEATEALNKTIKTGGRIPPECRDNFIAGKCAHLLHEWELSGACMALGYILMADITEKEWHNFLTGKKEPLSKEIMNDLLKEILTHKRLPIDEEKVNGTGGTGEGQTLANPMLLSVKMFLADIRSWRLRYREGEYVCADFAQEVYDAATERGIRCGYVVISFKKGNIGHAIVAFETDYGLKFFEPQSGNEEDVIVGRRYSTQLQGVPEDNVISEIKITWNDGKATTID